MGPPYKQNEEKSKFHILSVGYQNRVKGCVEFISEGIFGKHSKVKILVKIILKKVKTEIFSKTVGYVYKEESFDTIFNMGYGSGNSPMAERVKYRVIH